jgi:6-phosphofructokinase 2
MTTSIPQVASESTIVTLTMNPALDITTSTSVVVPTEKMRCSAARYDPGGGGINVARIAQVLGAAASAEFVVASGSLLSNVHPDFYQRVAVICRERGARLILDTSGGGLRHITHGVFLLKPSVRELRECVGRELRSESDQLAAAQELIERGCAENVVVSLGSAGALLVTPRHAHRYPAVPVPNGSGVGAGDAMVAAMAVGLSRGWPFDKAIRLGIAAGAAMLMTPGTAPCSRADVERLFEIAPEPTEIWL